MLPANNIYCQKSLLNKVLKRGFGDYSEADFKKKISLRFQMNEQT